MGHANCNGWDYDDHPKRTRVTERCERLVKILREKPERFDRYQLSTKPGHKFIFHGMAPDSCSYLVGNYRGDDFPCLRRYNVGVGGDSRVGVPATFVAAYVGMFEKQTSDALMVFNKQITAGTAPPAVLLAQFVAILADMLQLFLTIHPYANGNGHMGRLFVWVLMGRFSYWPQQWPLDTSPSYHEALSQHRNGNKQPLQHFILQCIIGNLSAIK